MASQILILMKGFFVKFVLFALTCLLTDIAVGDTSGPVFTSLRHILKVELVNPEKRFNLCINITIFAFIVLQ